MGIFNALSNAYTVEEAFGGSKDITTTEMKEAIAAWFSLYFDGEKTKNIDPCQRIPYTVVSKLTKTCFGEYSADSKDGFVHDVLAALDARKQRAMQMLLVGGEGFIKPVPLRDGFVFNIVRRDCMLVFGRDHTGAPCDIGTIERSKHGTKFYTLLERRTVGSGGLLTIRNTLYASETEDQIGRATSLQAVEAYANLPDEYTYSKPLGGLGLVHMKMPTENTVDGSPDGVSVYAPALGLILNIYENEAQINGEFSRGKSKVFASADLMKRRKDGSRHFDDDVFVALDDSPDNVGVTIFSPGLRIEEYGKREQKYLRSIESVLGIKRGLLSEVEAVERTAKEITSSEGDYNLTITDLQGVWTKAVFDTIRLCGILGTLYKVSGAHEVAEPEKAVTIDFGNGILYDEDKVWSDYKDMVARGLLKPEIALGWRFNMPTETESDLARIREKYMPDITEGGEE